MKPPRGIWCVLDAATAADLPLLGIAALAAGAAALTLRRPAATAGAAVSAWSDARLAGAWRAVHGHGDWAAASGAAAVIAGAASLSVADYRRAFPGLLVGASVHDAEEIARAVDAGAHFLVYGPVWETPSKRGVLPPRGLDGLAAAAAGRVPVIAIGGIQSAAQVGAAFAAGAHACAVARAARSSSLLGELVLAAR